MVAQNVERLMFSCCERWRVDAFEFDLTHLLTADTIEHRYVDDFNYHERIQFFQISPPSISWLDLLE